MPKKYLRVSALILPHEREAYAAYRMQPKRESCAALYQALRENMATRIFAAKKDKRASLSVCIWSFWTSTGT